MEKRFFDLHVFINRKSGYSLGVIMEVPIGTDIQDNDVIEFAEKSNLFTEKGDGEMVDTVDEVTEIEYNNIY